MKPHVLRDYQRKALAYATRATHPALLLGMRLGKCLVTIRRIKSYSKPHKDYRHLCLIVCPNPAFTGWKLELEREGFDAPVELTGTRPQRLKKLLLGRMGWYIINTEGWRALPEIAKVRWDVVIVDEKSICDPGSKITQFFLNNFRDVPHRWQLSGKLAPENDMQYITPLWFLNPAIWGQRPPWKRGYYFQIRDKYFEIHPTRRYEWRLRPNMRDEFRAILAKNCFILDQRDVKLGGLVIHEQRTVEFPDYMRKAYDVCAKEFLLEIDGQEIARTIYATGKHILLRRLCGGMVPGMEPWTGKMDELVYLLEHEFADQQVIIWSMYTLEIDMLEQVLGALAPVARVDGSVVGEARAAAEKAFKTGEARYFVAYPGCYQYGADLSMAKVMIYYSSPESADMRDQSEKRFVNLEHKHTLLVVDLVVNDTIDEDIVTSQLLKEGAEAQTRRIIKRLQNASQES